MNGFKALIFDVDGTLAETEEVHRCAFNESFAHFGLDWHWSAELYAELLLVTGGKERMRHFATMRQPKTEISDERLAQLHRYKTIRFGELIAAGACALRPGVVDMLDAAVTQKQRLAIATTTSRDNVDALLLATLGQRGLDLFDPIVAGEDVADKKPAPDVYVKALALLGLPARECLAIEDSRNGLVAASSAGIPVLVTRSAYFKHETFDGAYAVVDSLADLAKQKIQV
ncbi:cbbY (plasmid) [Afipia carboxidovorans OM5]|uniref:CbbY n=1 Tax=Afipia carboxidovorans (strain ATCC 49405 / DSM 1227 / KCTC 32145 / OM5) TaxID=504832 RepID=F8C116_AFIC5|nr:HAD-IA family hydrolase [Afipia carboxidovorans]AEI04498.1 cbbY [Afipia carboxidovorans OM4]AEI08126.1 cbbY [Afipia carboxidovorans OM5]